MSDDTMLSSCCTVSWCSKPVYARSLCVNHYAYRRRRGAAPEDQSTLPADRDDFGRKRCTGCRAWRAEEEFSRNRAAVDGLASRCKGCDARKNRVVSIARHGLTVQDYERLLTAQGGVCAICGGLPASGRLSIDHDHSCCPGKHSCGRCVRGLLCPSCNAALGSAGDDPTRLVAMAEYLRIKRSHDVDTTRVTPLVFE